MKKKYIFSIMAVAFIALTAIIFFFPDDVQGNVLQQHDTMQGIANGQEGIAYHEATGETTRWTNSLFGGMPNFQIAPSYPANSLLGWIGQVYMLGLPAPANLLFGMMFGFFILCLCMKFRWQTSLIAALAWGFSTYFIILIGAGHIWKYLTLAYIPPTIGGIVLLYRHRYIPGMALTALFGALQLQSNHPQMTYYFLFVILAMMIAWLVTAIRKHRMRQWFAATGLMALAGIIAVAANSASLYNSYEYAKETVRGRATELTPEGATPGSATGGMDRAAITAWSYGIDETFTLLVPNVKGGATIKPVGGENQIKSVIDTDKADELLLAPEEMQFLYQFPQYFGDQPMTNGPVYVGAFVLMLAILALFVVKSPMKWALFGVSVFAILLSWGHNFPALTDFFIDTFPGYNKFRAVSSILVIVEFCVPLLAALCIREMLDNGDELRRNPWTAYTVFGLGAFICFMGWVSPSIFGQPFSASEAEQLQAIGAFSNPAYSNIINAVRDTRLSLVSADSLRSLIFILLGGVIVWLYYRGKLKNQNMFLACVAILVLVDLFSVNRRYVDSENFVAPYDNETALNKTPVDEAILRDKSNYRVLDIPGFSQARSSYFHKTIGGYHAAKLTRYNDLIDRQISKNNMGVLNMLNTKYIIYQDRDSLGQPAGLAYDVNPGALGNAWMVDRLDYVDNADQEMAALDTLNTAVAAVADRKFSKTLGNATPKSPGDTIYETSYAPNKLTYKARTARGGVAAFSEIYFPWGWEATVDGTPAEIGRVNYVLRALRLAPGEHDIVFTFDPKSLHVTNTLGVTGVILIYILCAGALAVWLIKLKNGRNRSEV